MSGLARIRLKLMTGAALAALLVVAPSAMLAADFDLNGADATLPQAGHFNDLPYLNGVDDLTNSGPADATLTEGGGPAGTVYSGVVSDGAGTTAIVHTSGEVTFTGTNTYSGGTTLSGGTLAVQNDDALGTGLLIFNGGILAAGVGAHTILNDVRLDAAGIVDLDDNILELAGDIGGSFGLTVVGGPVDGVLLLGGNNSYSGPTTVGSTAVLRAASTTGLSAGSDFIVDGSLALNGFGSTIRSLAGSGLVLNGAAAATLTIAPPAATTVFSGSIDDGGPGALSLTKTGGGTQVLSGTSNYTGTTAILDGALVAASSTALSAVSDFRVNAGASLVIGDGLDADINSLADGPSGGGGVVIGPTDPFTTLFIGFSGGATTAFSGSITGSGNLELDGGSLTLTGAGGIGGDLFICDCSALTITGAGASFTVGGSGLIAPLDGSEILGALNVLDGARFVTDSMLVGGRMTADGRGTAVTASGLTFVGSAGTVARLTISGNAVVRSLGGVVIENPFAAAGATLTGGGVWNIGNGLAVGDFFAGGVGLLTVSAGGTANVAGGTTIGADPAYGLGPSRVTVTGAGSTFRTDTLDIGLTSCVCGDLPGTLTVADGGTVRASGGVTIAPAGILNLGAGGRAGTISANSIDNAGRIVADFTDTSTLGAIVSGPGTLAKNGVGRLILTANSTYGGATTVDGGTLAVNGSIANSVVTVNDGGTLGGTGTVGRTIVNDGGAIAPGNSVGTLTVRNGLAFALGSGYLVEIEGPNADRTNVVAGPGGPGNAALSGGAVEATFLATGNLLSRYTILSAAGGLGGTRFRGVTDNAPGILTSLSYDAGNVYLDTEVALDRISGLTVNQRNVAAALNGYFDRNGTLPLAFATLDPAGLTVASGELGTGAIQAGFEASDRFLDVISDRFALPEGAGAEAQPSAYTKESASGSGAAHAYGELLEKRSAHRMGAVVDGAWKTWGAVYGAAAEVDGDETIVGSHDLDTDVYGLAAGAGWREGDLGFGVALGGGRSSFDLADGLGSGDAGIFNAGIYGRAEFGRAYFLGALAYGYHDVETSRTAFGDVLTADYGAHSFSGRAEAGYRFDTGFVGLTPYAAFQGTSFRIPSYGETASGAGTFALDYDGDTATSARGELGLRLDRAIVLDGAVLNLTGRAAWAHSADNERSMFAGFQTLPGTGFTVYGAEPAKDSALLDLGAGMFWQNGWSASLAFQGRFAENYDSYFGSLKVGFTW